MLAPLLHSTLPQPRPNALAFLHHFTWHHPAVRIFCCPPLHPTLFLVSRLMSARRPSPQFQSSLCPVSLHPFFLCVPLSCGKCRRCPPEPGARISRPYASQPNPNTFSLASQRRILAKALPPCFVVLPERPGACLVLCLRSDFPSSLQIICFHYPISRPHARGDASHIWHRMTGGAGTEDQAQT